MNLYRDLGMDRLVGRDTLRILAKISKVRKYFKLSQKERRAHDCLAETRTTRS